MVESNGARPRAHGCSKAAIQLERTVLPRATTGPRERVQTWVKRGWVNNDNALPARAGTPPANRFGRRSTASPCAPRRPAGGRRPATNGPPALTLDQIAAYYELTERQAAHLIALARRQLFCDLSDVGIYKRRQRQKGRKPCRCAETNCRERIPITAPANKKYCETHATGAARVHRHRRQRQTSER